MTYMDDRLGFVDDQDKRETMKNGKLKIEKGIPIPKAKGGRNSEVPGLMRSMKRGDSILLPCSVFNANSKAAKYIGSGRYAVRREGEGARVWRVK